MIEKTKKRSLTEGNILSSMLFFSIPMIIGNLLQQVYNIADTMVVGIFLGAEALAAVGSAYTLMTFITSILIGLCMGSSASLSISYGAGNEKEMKESIWVSFWFILIVAIMLNIIASIFIRQILHILQVPNDVYPLIYQYIRIIFYGIIPVFVYNYFSSLLRATGNSVVPLCFLALSSVLNVFLDILFVAKLKRGVAGAAEATVISQIISALGIAIYTFLKEPVARISKEHMHIRKSIFTHIASYSLLTSAQQSVMNFGILMIQGLVNSFGTMIMAAFAVAVKIDTLAYMPAQEFGNAFSLFISQNFGARKYDRIRKGTRKAFAISIVFCILISSIVWIFSSQLIGLFLENPDGRIIDEGIRYLHIEGAFYFGIGILFLLYGFYRAIEKPKMSLILTILSLGTRVVLAYLLAPNPIFGVKAIWWAIPIGWILADTIGFIYYFVRIRKKLKE